MANEKYERYGIVASARVGLNVFETSQRRSGRTMRMMINAKKGDLIVTSDDREAARIRTLLREMKKDGVTVTHSQSDSWPHGFSGRIDGSVIYDHSYILWRVENALRGVERDMDEEQRHMSKTPRSDPEFDSEVAVHMTHKGNFG